MAAALSASYSLSLAAVAPARVQTSRRQSARASIPALGNFSGLKVQKVAALCEKKSVEEEFAQIAASYRQSNGSKGGALTSKCDLASEIFSVIPIISGLVLLGVALGFVLLRVEAAVEESE